MHGSQFLGLLFSLARADDVAPKKSHFALTAKAVSGFSAKVTTPTRSIPSQGTQVEQRLTWLFLGWSQHVVARTNPAALLPKPEPTNPSAKLKNRGSSLLPITAP